MMNAFTRNNAWFKKQRVEAVWSKNKKKIIWNFKGSV